MDNILAKWYRQIWAICLSWRSTEGNWWSNSQLCLWESYRPLVLSMQMTASKWENSNEENMDNDSLVQDDGNKENTPLIVHHKTSKNIGSGSFLEVSRLLFQWNGYVKSSIIFYTSNLFFNLLFNETLFTRGIARKFQLFKQGD